MKDTGMSEPKPQRFTSLDVFRGATIFLMIVVNTAGPGAPAYEQLVHAKWIGFTLADLVFPTFLFAMGNAMSFALRKPLPAGPYLARLLRRGATIFALGFLMYWFPFVRHGEAGWELIPFALTRMPGVLQRLALCYVLAGVMVRWLNWRVLLGACAGLLLAYWAILMHFGQAGDIYGKIGNAGTRLDLWLLSPGHLYKKDGGFDPEGFLGTLPAVVNVLAGYLAGLLVQRGADLRDNLRLMLVAGLACILAAHGWEPYFPISKKLWTGSFVLLTSGLDLMLLAWVVWMIEIRQMNKASRFFTILGRNPLAIYLFSELLVIVLNMVPMGDQSGIYDWLGIHLFQTIAPGAFGSLLCALAYTLVCWAMGWWMDKRGLILRA
jgi:predicted acyltransferase